MARILRLFVLTVATSFAAGCTQLPSTRELEQSLVFYPSTDADSWVPLPANVRAEDVWLRTADGLPIHARWFPQPGSKGAILFCHGNAGNLSHWSAQAINLQRALQQSVLIFDYPGYGKSAGKPSESGCYAAADAAWAWLTLTQGVPGPRIVVVGESLGGGVATELAVRQQLNYPGPPNPGFQRGDTELAGRRQPGALVLIRTFTSIPDMARKNTVTSSAARLVTDKFDSLSRIPKCKSPVFIAHGDRDQVIPLSQGQRLYDAAGGLKRFYLLKGLGHNDPLPADFFDKLNDFLRQSDILKR